MVQTKIFVVSHRDEEIQGLPSIYSYIGVGPASKKKRHVLSDSDSINIADKNDTYCELTAHYWIWKNVQCEIVGLVHYRRFFYKPLRSLLKPHYLNEKDIRKALSNADVIVPQKESIVSEKAKNVYEHYCLCHKQEDIDKLGDILKNRFPDYFPAFQTLMASDSLFPYNMLVCRKELFDSYSAFLFDVLGYAEKEIDISQYDRYQRRIFGFFGERLLNIYLMAHPEIRIAPMPILQTEKGRGRQIVRFVASKF